MLIVSVTHTAQNPARDKRKKPSPLAASKMSRTNGHSSQSQSNGDSNSNSHPNQPIASSGESDEQLNELVRTLGKARAALGSYRCHEAIETLNALLGPELGQGALGSHVGSGVARTASALCWLGKAYFECADYIKVRRLPSIAFC